MVLPRLTLFTGGPLCTLCTTFKASLATLQLTHPFHLTTIDITRPPPGTHHPLLDSYELTAWRRLYQYDVPVLHWSQEDTFDSLVGRDGKGGGRIMKHRLNESKLKELINQWTNQE